MAVASTAAASIAGNEVEESRSREVEQSRVKSQQMPGFSTLTSDSLTPRLLTPRLAHSKSQAQCQAQGQPARQARARKVYHAIGDQAAPLESGAQNAIE